MDKACVVVIGSGAFGASIAYHLAAMGLRDIILVDRCAIASQNSPRAAGLAIQNVRHEMTARLLMHSVSKFVCFPEEVGEPLDYHESGSVTIARTKNDERRLRMEVELGRARGIEINDIGCADLLRIAPYITVEGVQAAAITTSDLTMNPAQVAEGYSRAAARLGVRLLPFTEVTGIEVRQRRVVGVTTSNGQISSPIVVNAAGTWARKVGTMAKLFVPALPIRHQVLITEPLAGVSITQPSCRVMDARVYARPHGEGLMLGGYEQDPAFFALGSSPAHFDLEALPLDIDVLGEFVKSVSDVFPVLRSASIEAHRGGLPTLTPDGHPILGEAVELVGYFLAAGCCVGGLSISPAVGQVIAELIINGESTFPLDDFSLARFACGYTSEADLQAACLAAYGHTYR